jgi:GxxExxY protein
LHDDVHPDRERLASIIVNSGLKVHRALGPGLLESAYEHCLSHELRTRGLAVERQIPLPIVYDGTTLDAGYWIDIMVEHAIIVEIKAVEALTPVHHAQLLTYLKLSRCRIGFLMNFHVALFKQGVKRMVL